MNEKVLNHFVKLDQLKTRKNKKGIILIDHILTKQDQNNKYKINIGDTSCYFKQDMQARLLAGMAGSRMYSALGIPTPITSLAKPIAKDRLFALSQDVYSLKNLGFDVIHAHKSPLYSILSKNNRLDNFADNKWADFCNPVLNDFFLQYMTPTCLDELKNIYLLDELRTDPDRHWLNFFFYKEKDSDKYEGIVPIDLEHGYMFSYGLNYDKLIDLNYSTYTIRGDRDFAKTYTDRLKNLKFSIQKGCFENSQIEILKQGIQFDFPTLIDFLHNKYFSRSLDEQCDNAKRLWELNYRELSKDLNL